MTLLPFPWLHHARAPVTFEVSFKYQSPYHPTPPSLSLHLLSQTKHVSEYRLREYEKFRNLRRVCAQNTTIWSVMFETPRQSAPLTITNYCCGTPNESDKISSSWPNLFGSVSRLRLFGRCEFGFSENWTAKSSSFPLGLFSVKPFPSLLSLLYDFSRGCDLWDPRKLLVR